MKWTETRHYDVLEAGVWKHLHRVRAGWIAEQVQSERRRHAGAFRILDVGCGDGVITKRLRASFPDSNMRGLLTNTGFEGVTYAKFGLLFPHYYLHVALVCNRLTFAIGHWISQQLDVTADSLIFVARKTNPAPERRS